MHDINLRGQTIAGSDGTIFLRAHKASALFPSEHIEALACLGPEQDWTATIAGNGDIEGIRARVRELSITNRVQILNWLDTAQLLRRTDILVLPTFLENLPLTILEAFSCGIPVITTPAGVISEAVDHGRNGLLVPVGEIEPLAEALIRDADLRQRMGQAAREDHTRAYEIHGYVTRLVNIWREVAESSRRAAALHRAAELRVRSREHHRVDEEKIRGLSCNRRVKISQ